MKNYDLLIIGSGPGGYVAAIRAAQLGLSVAIVEEKHLGGICLNWGCIPTKALLKASELNYKLKHLADFGFSANDISFDFKKVVERSRKVANQLSGGISGLMKKNKVDVVTGRAKIIAKNTVEIIHNNEKQQINAKHIIVATGARARTLKGFEPDGNLVLTYKEAMVQESLPKNLCIVGSGAIGMEFASFYQNMGSQVTILEAMPRILPVEDEEISKIAHKEFEKQGMKIHAGVKLEKFEKKASSVVVYFDGKTEEFAKIIMAVGIVPNVENIGVEEMKVAKDDRGHIKTNEYLETNVENIYAIGDVTQGPWLAHKASHEGVIVAEFIASKCGKFDKKNLGHINRHNIPGCTYTRPQVASVGLTESQAKEKSLAIKVGRFAPVGNGKAIASGETVGLVKTIFDAKTGELLGVHMIGGDVTEMISAFLVGKQAELVEKDFMHTVFPHPTMSEMMHESVLDAFGRCLHM
jgi:dihydrolipoamide dehydrogenase